MATEPAKPAKPSATTGQERPAARSEGVFSSPPLNQAAATPRPASQQPGPPQPGPAAAATAPPAPKAAGPAAAAQPQPARPQQQASAGAPAEARPATPQQAPAQGRLVPADAATAAAVARAGQAGAAVPAAAPKPQPPAGARPAPVPAQRPGGAPPALPPGAANWPAARPPAAPAVAQRRHWVLAISFALLVLLPSMLWGLYLWTRATDQYTSTVGFSVRREEGAAPIDMFGGIFGGTASSTASDTDILYEFIRSPDIVNRVNQTLNIQKMFSEPWPRDFIFAYDPEGTIEDLTKFWNRQVRIYYDDSSGIITVRTAAFTPQDAKAIADVIFSESEKVVNSLSEQARIDATRQAEAELEKARGVLTEARQAMTAFRVRTRIVDPTIDLGAQMTVMTTLQGQLAEAQVQLDTLRQNARANDQRVVQAEKRIASLEAQIEAERDKFGGTSPEGENYAQMMADYERLKVDLEFAEGAHQTARVAYESALATAQRQTRYLAAHISPSEAQRSLEPDRPWLLGMGTALAFVLWSIMILVYYSVRDRR